MTGEVLGYVAAWGALAITAAVYLGALGRVRGRSRGRAVAFVGGLALLGASVASPIAQAAEELLSWHMVQHLVMVFAVAPLLVLGAPVTLALRAAPGRVRAAAGRLMHRGFPRLLLHPMTAWIGFALVLWGVHFSPLYDLAAGDPLWHALEHGLLLGAALLFWIPVAGGAPGPRLSHPVRLLYLVAAMPIQAFLGLAIYSAGAVLYPHYAEERSAAAAFGDQRDAGVIMWVGGDLAFVGAIAVVVWGWMRRADLDARREDRRVQRAA
ncbi:MAG: cytochrome c oxidase assembly protein [Actinomycetota bacterium]